MNYFPPKPDSNTDEDLEFLANMKRQKEKMRKEMADDTRRQKNEIKRLLSNYCADFGDNNDNYGFLKKDLNDFWETHEIDEKAYNDMHEIYLCYWRHERLRRFILSLSDTN